MRAVSYFDFMAGVRADDEKPLEQPSQTLTDSIRMAMNAQRLGYTQEKTLELMEQRAGFGIEVIEEVQA